jgi:nitric oxide reductase NorQ protein
MDADNIADVIDSGNVTHDDIADATGMALGHVARELKEFAEDPTCRVVREKDGHTFEYDTIDADATADATPQPAPATDATASEPAAPEPTTRTDAGAGLMPVSRGYSWDDHVATPAADYMPTNGEWDAINADIDGRELTGRHVRVMLSGPTGSAKTLLAQNISGGREWPLFTVQGRYSMSEADLLGTPMVAGNGETMWVDGVLTKALMCSQDRPCILLVDEANRMRPEAASTLFSALDHRGAVTLDGGRGGEVIEGDLSNLIVICTINEGREYHGTQQMDLAARRRFGSKYRISYLGQTYPDREATLVCDQAVTEAAREEGIEFPRELARDFVNAANDIRDSADNDDESAITAGVPVADVIEWAQQAVAYDHAGRENPCVEAGRHAIAQKYYGDAEAAFDEVMATMRGYVDGAPVVDDDAVDAWEKAESEKYVCSACGWEALDMDVPDGAAVTHDCPECDAEAALSIEAVDY